MTEPESENIDVTVGGSTTAISIMDLKGIDAALARIISGFAELRSALGRGMVEVKPPPTSES